MKSDEPKEEKMNEARKHPGAEEGLEDGADLLTGEDTPSVAEGDPSGRTNKSDDTLDTDLEGDEDLIAQEEGDEGDGVFVELEDSVLEELETLQAELARARDQHLRLAADFENYRKRVNADILTGWTRAQAELAGSLLEGLDDLQRVSQFTTEDATLDTLIEGVDLVERKFMKALTGAGLEAFEPVGEVFDPNTMEAMMRVKTEEEGQEGTVHQVFQKGYMFKEQLVRPARVSVYSDDD